MLITVYKNIKKIKRGGYDVFDINIIQDKKVIIYPQHGHEWLPKFMDIVLMDIK